MVVAGSAGTTTGLSTSAVTLPSVDAKTGGGLAVDWVGRWKTASKRGTAQERYLTLDSLT